MVLNYQSINSAKAKYKVIVSSKFFIKRLFHKGKEA